MTPKTIFCDIDGCILLHPTNFINSLTSEPKEAKFLPQVKEKLLDWHCQGHRIILTTGRPGRMRKDLEAILDGNKIFYHDLIMDCGSGVRVLINDIDPRSPDVDKAVAINLNRNDGIGVIEDV